MYHVFVATVVCSNRVHTFLSSIIILQVTARPWFRAAQRAICHPTWYTHMCKMCIHVRTCTLWMWLGRFVQPHRVRLGLHIHINSILQAMHKTVNKLKYANITLWMLCYVNTWSGRCCCCWTHRPYKANVAWHTFEVMTGGLDQARKMSVDLVSHINPMAFSDTFASATIIIPVRVMGCTRSINYAIPSCM